MSQETSQGEPYPPSSQLFELIWPGGLAAQAVCAAARLGLADLLAEGPKSVAEIARDTHAHEPSLYRLLKALGSLGLFFEDENGRFRSTPMGASLETAREDTTHPWAVFLGSPFLWSSWGGLYDNVMTGKTAFEQIHGTSFYRWVADHPEDGAIYDQAMTAGSMMTSQRIVEAYDFSRFRRLVDVGGGQGALLEQILEANPELSGALFDLPAVVAGAEALRQGAVAERCEILAGDAFDGLPRADAFLLKTVVHSYDDEAAVRLLSRCREAIEPGGRLLLAELVLDPSHEDDPRKAMMDLMMLTLVPGRERTQAEFEELVEAAGFSFLRTIPTSGPSSIVEAEPRAARQAVVAVAP